MKEGQKNQNEELLKQGADLLADIFIEQILYKYSNKDEKNKQETIQNE
ncbi:hypothetical protein KKA15_06825 [Patescibacteria group bacterium]|nr:hypothetical protein [Patescibacteria group bacterium]